MSLPTNDEQEILEWINRLRADPSGEFDRLIPAPASRTGVTGDVTNALRFFNVDVNLFRNQMLALTAAAPLAWSSALEDAAAVHDARMIGADTQSHQLPGEGNVAARARSAGYESTFVGENIYAFARTTVHGHAGFVIDWGNEPGGIQSPPGHRLNLMNATYTEIGIDVTPEANPATSVGPLVITEDLGTRSGYRPQFVGVVFGDADNDHFYDAGEGYGNVSVTVTGTGGTFTTTTWASGGYQIAVPQGSYTISFSGGSLTRTVDVQAVLGPVNRKVDLDAGPSNAVTPPSSRGFAAISTSTGRPIADTSHDYVGPVAGLRNEFITVTSENINVSVSSENWFIHTGSGDDAVTVKGGTNVIDAGPGSNFLVGGGGKDTFYIDDRFVTEDIWSTIANFSAGDEATLWGITTRDFKLAWVDDEGANGYRGLTLHATAPGKPIASLTLTGYSASDLANGRIAISFGFEPVSQSNFMFVVRNA